MKTINEYLLSKRNPKTIEEPTIGCTKEDIINWLESMGVTDRREFDMSIHRPNAGELLYEVGPKDYTNPGQYWVSLIGNPEDRCDQVVCIKPKRKSFFTGLFGSKEIEFEKALELAVEMIKNPNKVIRL